MNARDTAALEVQGLAVRYGHVAALRDLSFSIRDGECFALVGESGSGKSTALRAIAGLAPVSSGKIFRAGQEIRGSRDAAFYRSVQMVFQDPYGALHPRQTIERQLLEPLRIHGFDNQHARVRRMVSRVGLTDRFLYRFPHQLSGGQRQRVVIARALLMEPRVLLLDEPTSALDVSIQAEILNLLMDLHDEFGLTYLLVSHDLAVVATMCSRLLVMKEGLAVEELSTQQLREGRAETAYARALFRASLGYVGEAGAPA